MPAKRKIPANQLNGRGLDIITANRLERMVNNLTTSLSRLGGPDLNEQRNIDKECGYPENDTIDALYYRKLYDREAIANRVVECFPRECWLVSPEVYSNPDRDPDNKTEFELAWDSIGESLRGDNWYKDKNEEGHPVWDYMQRLDIRSGIGTFGVMLLGIDDNKELSEPIEGIDPTGKTSLKDKLKPEKAEQETEDSDNPPPDEEVLRNIAAVEEEQEQEEEESEYPQPQEPTYKPKHKLIYLRVFDESQIQILEREGDKTSPRYGMPTRYMIDFDDPTVATPATAGVALASQEVHWTRVIHAADNLGSSEVFGNPRMLPVLNRLLDLRKIYGSDAEAWWKAVIFLLALETHPQLGGDVTIDIDEIRDVLENIFEGTQRYLPTSGVSAKAIAPAISDPTPHIKVQIEAICIQLGIPMRIFMGSERGELASSQDDGQWNDRLDGRCKRYVTPQLICPFVNRLIMIGILPVPEQGFYCVAWPDRSALTEQEQADIALKRTQAFAQYVSGNVESVIPVLEYLVMIHGMTMEDAQEIDDARMEQTEADRATPDPEQARIEQMESDKEKFAMGQEDDEEEGDSNNPFAKKKEEEQADASETL